MDYFSLKADRDREERLETKDFLFATVPGIHDPEKLEGIGLGGQIEEFKNILSKMKDREIFKIFRAYIRTKKMTVQTLKEPQEWEKHVDKIYREENNLICISAVENKIPPTDVYYSTRLGELKEDFIKFYSNFKE